jgi:iron complex transport system ATP-binding protein
LTLIREIAHAGRCALVALHDLALAARFCDRLLLLADGKLVAQGKPEAVLTESHLAAYFRLQAKIQWNADVGGLIVLPLAPSRPVSDTQH